MKITFSLFTDYLDEKDKFPITATNELALQCTQKLREILSQKIKKNKESPVEKDYTILDGEYFIPIHQPFEEYYLVSNLGRIFSLHKKMFLSGSREPSGYISLKLTNGIIELPERMHQAVLNSWRGATPPDMEIDHLDHNRSNNELNNLRFLSVTANRKRKYKKYFISRKPNSEIIYLQHFKAYSNMKDVRRILSLKKDITDLYEYILSNSVPNKVLKGNNIFALINGHTVMLELNRQP